MKVIVTGHSSGIGLYCFEELHKLGFEMVGIDKNVNGTCDAYGVQYKCDLSDEIASKKVFEIIGDYDIAINCAGASSSRKRFEDFDIYDFMDSFNLNFSVFFNSVSNEVWNAKLSDRRRRIINIASITASFGGKNMSAYSSVKAAMINLTKVIAVENAPDLLVNSISPATIDTPMIRSKYDGELPSYRDAYLTGSCGKVSDVFSVVKMLIENDFITGQDIPLDGGYSSLFELKL